MSLRVFGNHFCSSDRVVMTLDGTVKGPTVYWFAIILFDSPCEQNPNKNASDGYGQPSRGMFHDVAFLGHLRGVSCVFSISSHCFCVDVKVRSSHRSIIHSRNGVHKVARISI